MRTKRFLKPFLYLVLVLGLMLSACTGAETEEPSDVEPKPVEEVSSEGEGEEAATSPEEVEEEKELTKVRVGHTPFFDYQFWAVAEEFGWDEELGLDLDIQWLTQSGPAVQAVAAGSVDIANTCVVCNFPFIESIPELRSFTTVDQFKGFIVVGRRGECKSYEEFLEELGNHEDAKNATIAQFKGSTWPLFAANYRPMVKGMLEQGGLTLDDIEILDFPDDEKSALAMLGGTGDYYVGGLPAELNLLTNHPDEFMIVGGAEIMGPAGVFYGNLAATEEWLAENEDAALKVMAMMYRYNRYVQEARDKILPIVVESLNSHSGVATDEEEYGYVMEELIGFKPYQQEQEETYNPESIHYWGNMAEYYATGNPDLPEDFDYKFYNPVEEWFEKFLAREDLLEWVDAPIE
jgi:ABC-type nitrate/sulfonate/bicarbonate transport system substrate-binding protein